MFLPSRQIVRRGADPHKQVLFVMNDVRYRGCRMAESFVNARWFSEPHQITSASRAATNDEYTAIAPVRGIAVKTKTEPTRNAA